MKSLREICPLIIEGWKKHKDGTYSAFMSDIAGHMHDTGKRARHPITRKPLNDMDFKKHYDKEGDITHWSSHNGKVKIWND